MDVQLPKTPVPVFPLPGVFLFPHQVLPLHVFEPRYRAMVKDLLDGPGRLVIATTLAGERETADHAPELAPVAGLGEILRHEQLPDGRYTMWVLGLTRVHLHEVPSDHPYRLVEVLPFVETGVPDDEAAGLSQELREATSQRLKEPLPLPETTPPGLLADLLLQTLQAPRSLVERAFSEPDVQARARLALREAERSQIEEHDGTEGEGGDPLDFEGD